MAAVQALRDGRTVAMTADVPGGKPRYAGPGIVMVARIGRRISYDRGKTWRTVVGVVGDIRQAGLSEEPRPTMYLPFAQFPGYSSTLIVRTTGDPTALTGALRTIFRELAPDTALGPPRTLEQIRHESLASPRAPAGRALPSSTSTTRAVSGSRTRRRSSSAASHRTRADVRS